MAEAAKRLWSVDEFLAFEGEPDTRYQLVRGQVTAIAPAQAVHGRLVARLARLIGNQLQRPCEPITEAGVKPAHRHDSFWVADLAVNRTPLERGQIYLESPVLVIEVLSPSTQVTDRVFKLPDCRGMPGLGHILLVSTEAARGEHWRRAGELWQVRDLGPGAVFEIAEIGIEIALDELYADMLLEEGEGGSET
jgi:Uma2 family endonuclease